jgi:hypothetical protein
MNKVCIVQDDPADWKRESSLMSAVYGGSALNIAATGARDGSNGCFFHRPRQWRCQVSDDSDGVTRSYEAFSKHPLEEMPLLRRGWALQERLLPARTLHFAKTQAVWECHHLTACEAFPKAIPSTWLRELDRFRKQPLGPSMWSWIIEQYSASALSVPTDKLVALSGIARAIHDQTGDQYAAGMWRKSLDVDLCWEPHPVQQNRHTVNKRNTHIAPSWSWASQDARFMPGSSDLLGGDHVPLITILDLDIQPAGQDPFGQLAGARLRLSCRVLLHVTVVLDSNCRDVRIRSGDEEFGLTRDIVCETKDGDYPYYVWDYIYKCIVESDRREISKDAYLGQSDAYKVYALPIFQVEALGGFIRGLLLKAIDGERGTYKRMGSFTKEKLDNAFPIQYPHSADAYVDVLKDNSGIIGYVIDLI